jgi:glucuronate isomerase
VTLWANEVKPVLHAATDRFDRIHAAVAGLPVIDCHEHMFGAALMTAFHEPIAVLICGYVKDDLRSAGASQSVLRMLQADDVPTERKWPVFEPLWRRVQHTGYGRVTRLILKDVYGQTEMSLAALSASSWRRATRRSTNGRWTRPTSRPSSPTCWSSSRVTWAPGCVVSRPFPSAGA